MGKQLRAWEGPVRHTHVIDGLSMAYMCKLARGQPKGDQTHAHG